MLEKLKELYESRNKVWEDMKVLNDLITKENRDFTPEEDQRWDAMNADFEKHTADIEKIQKEKEKESRKTDRQKQVEERNKFMKSSKTSPIKPEPEGQSQKVGFYGTEEYRNEFAQFIRSGSIPVGLETRALQADKDVSGGYLVVPEQFIADLIMDLDNNVFVRQYAKVITMPKAASIGVPVLKDDMGDPSWTSELLIGSEDTTLDFAKREMIPHPLARYIKVSKKLIRVAELDVVGLVRERLGYKFATVEENAFLNGNGVNQPLGVMISSAAGISTARDVSTGMTATAITADGLWNCVYGLKAQYRKNARWAFHRDALKMIRKMKDGSGDYIWKAGIADGSPATICGYPYDESEYMPNTFTTALYVGILGNWSYYWIVDALDMEIQVLTELYAATNQNAYVGRKETDGAPVLEDAWVRVKLG